MISAKIVCGQCGAEVSERAVHVLRDRFGRGRGVKAHCNKCGNTFTKAPRRCRECNQFPGACRPHCSHNQNKRYVP